jgi:hypothetical protein
MRLFVSITRKQNRLAIQEFKYYGFTLNNIKERINPTNIQFYGDLNYNTLKESHQTKDITGNGKKVLRKFLIK